MAPSPLDPGEEKDRNALPLDDEQLFPCWRCGRTFRGDRIVRHERACAVAARPRAPFDVSLHRSAGTSAEEWVRRRKEFEERKSSTQLEAERERERRRRRESLRAWRASREDFRRSLHASRLGAAGAPTADHPGPAVTATDRAEPTPGRSAARGSAVHPASPRSTLLTSSPRSPTVCPHCGRQFAASVAARHVEVCAGVQARPSVLRAHTGAAATTMRVSTPRSGPPRASPSPRAAADRASTPRADSLGKSASAAAGGAASDRPEPSSAPARARSAARHGRGRPPAGEREAGRDDHSMPTPRTGGQRRTRSAGEAPSALAKRVAPAQVQAHEEQSTPRPRAAGHRRTRSAGEPPAALTSRSAGAPQPAGDSPRAMTADGPGALRRQRAFSAERTRDRAPSATALRALKDKKKGHEGGRAPELTSSPAPHGPPSPPPTVSGVRRGSTAAPRAAQALAAKDVPTESATHGRRTSSVPTHGGTGRHATGQSPVPARDSTRPGQARPRLLPGSRAASASGEVQARDTHGGKMSHEGAVPDRRPSAVRPSAMRGPLAMSASAIPRPEGRTAGHAGSSRAPGPGFVVRTDVGTHFGWRGGSFVSRPHSPLLHRAANRPFVNRAGSPRLGERVAASVGAEGGDAAPSPSQGGCSEAATTAPGARRELPPRQRASTPPGGHLLHHGSVATASARSPAGRERPSAPEHAESRRGSGARTSYPVPLPR